MVPAWAAPGRVRAVLPRGFRRRSCRRPCHGFCRAGHAETVRSSHRNRSSIRSRAVSARRRARARASHPSDRTSPAPASRGGGRQGRGQQRIERGPDGHRREVVPAESRRSVLVALGLNRGPMAATSPPRQTTPCRICPATSAGRHRPQRGRPQRLTSDQTASGVANKTALNPGGLGSGWCGAFIAKLSVDLTAGNLK